MCLLRRIEDIISYSGACRGTLDLAYLFAFTCERGVIENDI